ncbi:hypothetical protein D3C81_1065790 [compost metagenome]
MAQIQAELQAEICTAHVGARLIGAVCREVVLEQTRFDAGVPQSRAHIAVRRLHYACLGDGDVELQFREVEFGPCIGNEVCESDTLAVVVEGCGSRCITGYGAGGLHAGSECLVNIDAQTTQRRDGEAWLRHITVCHGDKLDFALPLRFAIERQIHVVDARWHGVAVREARNADHLAVQERRIELDRGKLGAVTPRASLPRCRHERFDLLDRYVTWLRLDRLCIQSVAPECAKDHHRPCQRAHSQTMPRTHRNISPCFDVITPSQRQDHRLTATTGSASVGCWRYWTMAASSTVAPKSLSRV